MKKEGFPVVPMLHAYETGLIFDALVERMGKAAACSPQFRRRGTGADEFGAQPSRGTAYRQPSYVLYVLSARASMGCAAGRGERRAGA
jgi:hypothetical protein